MGVERGHRRAVHQIAVVAALMAAAVILGMPFYWMVVTSLKTSAEAAQFPPSLWPETVHVENYSDAWQSAPFGRFYLNSVVTGVAATGIQVGFALLMAYAFAWIAFPGKRYLVLLVLATMMIPDEMKLIPNYLLLDRLGWIDTYWALIIPPAAHAFPVFVLHQHFLTIPRELIEAARADGAGHWTVLKSVCAPLSRPVIIAVTLVAFLGRWNDLLWPLVVTNREVMRTLPVGLMYLQGGQEGGLEWNLLMAAALFVIMPVLAIFVVAQRYFTAGLISGALKG